MECSWEEQLEQRFKYDRNLNFSTISCANGSEDDFNCQKKKVSRDPMSHRIIEKRRRDRMNNCLADLSSLIPSNYLKKGRGRIEKTEIIEMAIKHLKQLQAHRCKTANGCPEATAAAAETDLQRQYCLGYQECLSETMHFLVEVQVCYPGDNLCVQIMNHLHKHRERIFKGRRAGSPSKEPENFAKRSTESPDGSLPDRSSQTSFQPISVHEQRQQSVAVPKVEPDASPSNGSSCDVHMSDPEECRGSQLREMLQNPSLQSRARSMSASSSRPVSTAGSTGGSTVGFGDAEVYKFKRNIKERFKADQSVIEGPIREGPPSAERRFSEPVLEVPVSGFGRESGAPDASRLQSLLTFSSSSSSSSSSSAATEKGVGGGVNRGPVPQREVPVFVLHPGGGFYVPMTVAASLVRPHLDEIPDVVPQLLHHVGLAVYFNGGGDGKATAAAPEKPVHRLCNPGVPGFGEGRTTFQWNTVGGPT